MKRALALFVFIFTVPAAWGACTGGSPTWTTTPDSASVQTCITTASAGDTINISAGSASWGLHSVVVSKAVTLNGAGQGVTNITVTAHSSFDITKPGGSGILRIKNLTFLCATGANTLPHPITINGAWPSTAAVIFQNVTFTVNDDTPIDNFVAGGNIFSHITFNSSHYGDFFMTIKDLTHTASWTTADSFGTHDTTGLLNNYVEDSSFVGGQNGFIDCDDNCRIVWRHNQHGVGTQDGGGFNSHGHDSSPYGMREFEIYSNSWIYPDKTCAQGTTSASNIGQYIWIRGGSGVIYNNSFAELTSQCWGKKGEIRLNNRGAEDDRPGGITCAADVYPVNHQIGQNNNGSNDFTDPIWFWGNTGNNILVGSGWAWGNPCGFNWNTYWQWGRDGQNTSLTLPIVLPSGGGSVSALGGTPKPGYTAFTYPHPLVAPSSSPQLSFSPASVNFGNVATGSNASQTVTVSNVGTASEILSTPYFTLTGSSTITQTGGTCTNGGTIATSGSCTVIVKFTPTVAGAVSATLTINGTVSAAIALTGTGTTSASPPSTPTNFAVSASGPNVTLTWTASLGTPPITYNCQEGTASGGPFSTFTTTLTTSCVFTAGGPGTFWFRVSGTNSAGTSSPTSALSAVVAPTTPSAQLAPATLGFPSAALGVATSTGCSQSSTCTVVLTNTGTASLTITSISIAGANAADFSNTTTCGGSLAVSASCNIPVTFTPSTTGLESASLVLVSNDPTSPDAVPLSGTGFQGVTVSPASLSFGNQFQRKTSAAKTVTITNNSAGTLTFTSPPALTTGTLFVISSTTCGATVLAAASCSVSITFTPVSVGAASDTLTFAFTGPSGSPITVPVSGSGKKHGVLRVGAAVKWPYAGAEVLKTVLRPWKREDGSLVKI